MDVPSMDGERYLVTLINEASGHVRAFHMVSKSEAAEQLKHEVSWVDSLSGCMVEETGFYRWRKHFKGSEDPEACSIEIHPNALYTSQENGSRNTWTVQ